MYKNKFINISKQLSEKDLIELEEGLNIILPDNFKSHYLIFNGGSIDGEKDTFLNEDEDDYSLKTFFPIKYKRSEGDSLVRDKYKLYVERGQIPKHFLPIAMDYGGAPYCYDLKNKSIYFIDPDNDILEESISFVADSLQSFINGLMTAEEAYE